MATRFLGLDDTAASLVREIARPERRAMRRNLVSVVVAIATMAMVMLLWSGSQSPKVEKSNLVPRLTGVKAFHAACGVTPHREVCIQTLMPNYRAHAATPQGLTAILIATAAQGVAKTLSAVLANRGGNIIGFAGERVCHSTLVTAIQLLEATLAAWNESSGRAPFEDVQMRLRAAAEFHSTCIDALVATGALEVHTVEAQQHAEELLRNAASFVAAFGQFGSNLHAWEGPTPLVEDAGLNWGRTFLDSADALPSWMTSSQRAELLTTDPLIDAVVAKDGSAQFKSIQGAIDWAPPMSAGKRYVIAIKAGVYNGQVIVPKTATNFMFLGDGAASTIISANRSANATPGMTTFFSPSLIVEGAGFIGKGFTVRNIAAANSDAARGLPQAVAMRVAADRAAFDQCVFDGGQDTLHTHTFRQFYRNSTIAGAADRFILGNGALASFQSCTMVPKNQRTG